MMFSFVSVILVTAKSSRPRVGERRQTVFRRRRQPESDIVFVRRHGFVTRSAVAGMSAAATEPVYGEWRFGDGLPPTRKLPAAVRHLFAVADAGLVVIRVDGVVV